MRPVFVPSMDVNSESGLLVEWYVPDGGRVVRDQRVAEFETSKALLDVVAPEAGFLKHVVAAGVEVAIAEPIGYLFAEERELLEFAVEAHPAPASETAAAVAVTEPARRRALELGVDVASLRSSGLVTVSDVEAAARAARDVDLPDPLPAPPGVRRLAIIGAGLGATQVLDILDHTDAVRAVALFDDDAARWGGVVQDVPVAGGVDRLRDLFAARALDAAIISISTSVAARRRLRLACAEAGIPLANAVDPTVKLSARVTMGEGNVICAFCHFGVETRIGDNNFISAYNSFDHHSVLCSDISTGPACVTSALVRIGDGARLGTGIFIEPHVELGDRVQVASGAVIVASVPADHAVKTRVATTAVVPVRKR